VLLQSRKRKAAGPALALNAFAHDKTLGSSNLPAGGFKFALRGVSNETCIPQQQQGLQEQQQQQQQHEENEAKKRRVREDMLLTTLTKIWKDLIS